MNKFNFYLISLIFIVSFWKGALALIGISEVIVQLTIDLLIIILFFNAMLYALKRGKIIVPGLLIFIFLFIITIISFLLTDVNKVLLIVFIRVFFVYYLFFYALFNINLNTSQQNKLIKLIFFLFLIQIPAAFIKLVVLGGTLEKIIGTMSIAEGSLATIMPLMAISYLISNYLIYKNIKYMILIFLFIAIGLISNKLAILYYLIFLFIYLSYLYSNPKLRLPNLLFMKKIFINSIYLTIIFILFVMINPRSNPEHKVGGSFDIEYLIESSTEYSTKKPSIYEGEGQGRFDAPAVVFSKLYDGGIVTFLFGFGPGELERSAFSKYKDPVLEKYNLGYGARLGFLHIAMQIGTIGMIIMIWFHLMILKRILAIYKAQYANKEEQIFILTTLGFLFIFLLDYFSYSAISLTSPGVALVYYFMIFYVINLDKVSKEIKGGDLQ